MTNGTGSVNEAEDFVNRFNEAWKTLDDRAIMALFTPDAQVIRQEVSKDDTMRGNFVSMVLHRLRHIPEFRLESTDVQTNGNEVTWHLTAYKQGNDGEEEDGAEVAKAVLRGGKVAVLTLTYDDPARGRIF